MQIGILEVCLIAEVHILSNSEDPATKALLLVQSQWEAALQKLKRISHAQGSYPGTGVCTAEPGPPA